ncbi:phosphoribosylamine--glycine ligase [Candidatus Woesearchaeota archaeon]|nr:phosphoribosylamine--glycine ligase [Candidatus Woesearchaeota archaeon]
MNVLVIGSGGREHALGWRLAQSSAVSCVYYAPGNGGTAEGKCRNVSLLQFRDIAQFITAEHIGMTVVGPEAPLVNGLVDFLYQHGCKRVFGPTQKAAQLEADKFFSYGLMSRLSIPQAMAKMCYSLDEAFTVIRNHPTEQVVIKARGLTGGKGVVVCDSKAQALSEMVAHAATYGPEVLIAERLSGEEFSVFGISDGERVLPLKLSVQDHKRLLDGDTGPNTGGMGAYCPAPVAPSSMVQSIADSVMTPLVQQMKADGIVYKGFLYAGMMLTAAGPKVLEFNVRFGDPECQAAMMMVTNLAEVIASALDGHLQPLDCRPGAACCVVLASSGYPGPFKKGLPITGIIETESVKVFHAGTRAEHGLLSTDGGRVLGVTAYSPQGIASARAQAYDAASSISIPGGFHYRTDIASRALRKVRY